MSRLKLVPMAVLMLSGCTDLHQYRTEYSPCVLKNPSLDCAGHAIQKYEAASEDDAGYLLGIIEFDDQGQLFDRREEMKHVIDSIKEEARYDDDVLMVVFVHGWKNNADFNNDNIQNFRQGIYELSKTEKELSSAQSRTPRRVVGLFVGWRGLSISAPVLKEFTFWDRKETAHKVGRGEVTEILNELEQIRLAKDARARDGTSASRLVIIGHSFGAGVVFSSVEQMLESNFVKARERTDRADNIDGFGNLVVLVNPAFEALLYAPLWDVSLTRSSYGPDQLPRLAILTSEADDATKIAFPIGRWFDTRFEKELKVTRINPVTGLGEEIDEADANVTAVGHFKPFRTHTLRASGDPKAAIAITPSSSAQANYAASQGWEDDHPGSVIQFLGSTLTRTDDSVGRDPYLVVQVDKALIPDHNHIWDRRIMEFVTQLILVAGQDTRPDVRHEQRNSQAR